MKENLLVIDSDYDLVGNEGIVRLFCKSNKGETVLVQDSTLKPYFYAMPVKGKESDLKKKVEELNTKLIETEILKVEIVEKMWEGQSTKLVKITIDNPRKIPDVRELINDWKEVEDTYEYDIQLYKRYIIDKQINPMGWISVEGIEQEKKDNLQVDRIIKASSVKSIESEKEIEFRVLAFDTEFVEENEGLRLIMLSLESSEGFKKVLTYKTWENQPDYVESLRDEKEIIEKFMEVVKKIDPDFLVGYNSDNFDFPNLKDKTMQMRLSLKVGRDENPVHVVRRGRISSAKLKGRVHIDLFNFIDHILSPSMKSEVLTLDQVAQEFLGIGKKKMGYKEMVDIWSKKEQMEKLSEYSLHDSFLTLKLSELILPQIFALSKLTGTLPFDTCRNTYSQLVETFLMHKTHEDNVLIPNRPKTDEIERRRMMPVYRGAIVKEPMKGIHSNILVFDFKSMYPTIMVSFNISPDTLNCKCCPGEESILGMKMKWHFCKNQKGFIPKHLEELINQRKKIKDLLKKAKKGSEDYQRLDNEQYAVKILMNATYGYTGYFGAKWFCRECAETTAALGRQLITNIIEFADKEGFDTVYSDTDSVFLKLKEEDKTSNI